MAKKAAADFDPMDVLNSAATTKGNGAKPKSTVPDVQIDDPEINKAIEDFKKAHLDIKDAEARKAAAEAILTQPALDAKVKASRREGKFKTSIVLNGAIQVSTTNRYTAASVDNAAKLLEVFGDDYSKYFVKKTETKLTQAAITDPVVLKKLIDAVGRDKFNDFFEVVQHLEVTENLHHDRELDEEIGEKAQKAIEEGIFRPYKPTFKPR